MTRTIIGALGTALVAALAGGPPAAALGADIPGNASTGAVLPLGPAYTRGAFERDRDVDWYRIAVERGRHYAVQAIPVPTGGIGASYAYLALYDGWGRPLRRLLSGEGEGLEFTAAATGTMFVGVESLHARSYRLRYGLDLPGDGTTTATLAAGRTVAEGSFYATDDDWYRADLEAGRPYGVGLRAGIGLPGDWTLRIVDRRGRVLASGMGGIAGFRPPAAGRYYVSVRHDTSFGGAYRVRLRGG